MSEAASSDPDKVRRDQAAARTSLKKECRNEINSLSQKLKSRISHLESIRAFQESDAKKYKSASIHDQQRMDDLETQIASLSTLRDQHRAEIIDQKRELDRLQNVMADHTFEKLTSSTLGSRPGTCS